MTLRELLEESRGDVALVIGNGVNRYDSAVRTNSWDQLLLSLARKHRIPVGESVPEGVSLTEFYDLLELKKGAAPSAEAVSLQADFCAGMEEWRPYPHHEAIVGWARRCGAPILTTNFDDVLARAGGCRLLPDRTSGFTDFYPWERYFGVAPVERPDRGFGVWHVNGMQHYRRSIRLGLSHYMGSVERVRNWVHNDARCLYRGRTGDDWRGAETWLQIVFRKPLLIFGLALEENEVFLRWLLIERARYFRRHPARARPAWYVHPSRNEKEGKLFFLEGIGVKPVEVGGYDAIYSPSVWG